MKKEEGQKGVMIYESTWNAMCRVPAEQLYIAVHAARDYFLSGEMPEDSGDIAADLLTSFLVNDIERSIAQYQRVCERNKVNSNKKKANKDPVGPSGSQSLPVGSNKNENESESENVNKNENDSCSCSVSENGESTGGSRSGSGSSHTPTQNTSTPHAATAAILINQYRLPPDKECVKHIANDIEKYGLETVRSALDRAAKSDKKGGITIPYYATILNNLVNGT